MNKFSGIYQIQSKVKPERIYIGSAVSMGQRWNSHLNDLRNNRHHSKKLQYHYNKYGESDLQFSILLGCEREDLIKIEQYFIDSNNPYFNSSKTAGKGCNLGIHLSEEQKRNLSIFRKGKKLSQETCNKIANGHRGIKLSEDHRRHISESNKGRKGSLAGKSFSEEHRRKIGEANRRRKLSEETKKKISDAHKGTHPSEETKRKWRENRKGEKNPLYGKSHSDETKQKIRMRLLGNKNRLGKSKIREFSFSNN